MPLNFNPEKIDARQLQDNLRAIERHLQDDHYVRSLSPGAAVLQTATHTVIGNRWGVVLMPDAADTSCLWTLLRPSEWVTGKVAVTLWYSSNGGSTNNFRVLTQVSAIKNADVTSASTLLLNSTRTLAGPAVLNTLTRADVVYSTANITRDHELLEFRVQRTGTHADDNNVNEFHLYAVRATFISAYAEVT